MSRPALPVAFGRNIVLACLLGPLAASACDANPDVHPDVCPDDSDIARELYVGYRPTELPFDCRCQTKTLPCLVPSDFLVATGGERLGGGPVIADQGSAVEIRYGDLWPDRRESGEIITAVSVYTKEPGFVLGLDLNTLERRVLSGVYLDPRTGPVTVGEGELFGEPGYALRGPDDMVYVYAISHATAGEIFRVDPDSGDRTLVWRHGADSGFPQCMNGVPEERTNNSWTRPAPMQLQLEVEGFAVGLDGSFYLTTIPNGFPAPGPALINVAADGSACRVVTMGAPEAGNTYPAEGVGGGWPLQGYIEEVKQLPDGRLLINNRTLMEVDPVTGDRARLGEAPVGETRWDPTRNMLFITGVKNPRPPDMYFHDVAANKTWHQISCLVLEPGHPFTDQCVREHSGPFGSISEQQGWLTPNGKYAIWATPSTAFAIVDIQTGNNHLFSY